MRGCRNQVIFLTSISMASLFDAIVPGFRDGFFLYPIGFFLGFVLLQNIFLHVRNKLIRKT